MLVLLGLHLQSTCSLFLFLERAHLALSFLDLFLKVDDLIVFGAQLCTIFFDSLVLEHNCFALTLVQIFETSNFLPV